ncbi:hypothetical protein [Chryseobacterium aquifrigidense]|uniref:hypothetical protein n=1 Tax=Chryseobacterium aquifrigidense TaxID=558021 RepID=UPI00142EEF4B|nr:hypothetical protein [Chryseobacterium aquifrigidense]
MEIILKIVRYDSPSLTLDLQNRLTMSQKWHLGKYGEFQNNLSGFKRFQDAGLLRRENKVDPDTSHLT